eukprot:9504170-Pyramimonas_sp.AAC.4
MMTAPMTHTFIVFPACLTISARARGGFLGDNALPGFWPSGGPRFASEGAADQKKRRETS